MDSFVLEHKEIESEFLKQTLENYPGSRKQQWLVQALYQAQRHLKQMVLDEAWPETRLAGVQLLGLGYTTFRHLRAEGQAQFDFSRLLQKQKDHLQALFHSLAGREDREAILDRFASEENPPEVIEFLEKLRLGEKADPPFLEAMNELAGIPPSLYLDFLSDSAVLGLSRGLLGMVLAEYNLAYQAQGKRPRPDHDKELDAVLRAVTEEAEHALHQGQSRLYAAIVDQTGGRVEEAACGLAGQLEQMLPRLGRMLAQAAQAVTRLREKGKGAAAFTLGRTTCLAGAYLRQALTSHASAYCLALGLSDPESDVQALVRSTPKLAFSGKLPNGKNYTLSKLAEAPDGKMVEIEGFVQRLNVVRTDKLLTHLYLGDAGGKHEAHAVAVYSHLAHRGMTPGAFCRLHGWVRKKSPYAEEAIVEIDKLELAKMAEQNWQIAFLRLGYKYYSCWPNGCHMFWSLGPHQMKDRTEEQASLGAAELIAAKILQPRED